MRYWSCSSVRHGSVLKADLNMTPLPFFTFTFQLVFRWPTITRILWWVSSAPHKSPMILTSYTWHQVMNNSIFFLVKPSFFIIICCHCQTLRIMPLSILSRATPFWTLLLFIANHPLGILCFLWLPESANPNPLLHCSSLKVCVYIHHGIHCFPQVYVWMRVRVITLDSSTSPPQRSSPGGSVTSSLWVAESWPHRIQLKQQRSTRRPDTKPTYSISGNNVARFW